MFYNLLIVSKLQKAVQICLDYCKKNPILAIIIGVLGLALIGLIIAIPCVASSRKKKRLALEAEEKVKAEAEAKAKAEAEAKAKAEAQAKAEAEENAKAYAEAEAQLKAEAEERAKAKAEAEEKAKAEAETTPVAEPAPVEETPIIEAPAPVEETPAPVVEEPAPVLEMPAPVVEETKEESVTESTAEATAEKVEKTVQPVPAPIKTEKTKKQTEPKKAETPVANTAKQPTPNAARYTGKWVVYHMVTASEDGANKGEDLFFFELRASNGEKLLSSEEYTSYSGALRGIETHKKNILANNFRITLSKKGHYIFKLLNGKSTLLCTGENYPSKSRCEKAMESTKRFAETAVLDENTQELFIKLPPEDDAPIATLPDGYAGKWVIANNTDLDGETVYYFELFANNGEKLLSSEEYSSYIGAVNGIETHKKNISLGNFRIVLTKRGDYIYKLLNGNGQLLCLGEHYRTRKLCQNAVESVKRFSAGSPVLTNEKNKQN